MKRNFYNRFGYFHAGHFLEECLRCSGFDIQWLADKTNYNEEELRQLFNQTNMDAELFVEIGRPMGAIFFDRIHEEIFHEHKMNESMTVT